MKAHNQQQRFLRTPIEQTNAAIKQYKIVGNHQYRGDIKEQGINWRLCTYLTARAMRIRNKRPRGEKWLRGELEAEELALGRALFVDPLMPDLYL